MEKESKSTGFEWGETENNSIQKEAYHKRGRMPLLTTQKINNMFAIINLMCFPFCSPSNKTP